MLPDVREPLGIEDAPLAAYRTAAKRDLPRSRRGQAITQGTIEMDFRLKARTVFHAAAPAGLVLLGACTQAPAMDVSDSQRTEAAINKMKAEQQRTDEVEAAKRARSAALYRQSLDLPENQRGIVPAPTVRDSSHR